MLQYEDVVNEGNLREADYLRLRSFERERQSFSMLLCHMSLYGAPKVIEKEEIGNITA